MQRKVPSVVVINSRSERDQLLWPHYLGKKIMSEITKKLKLCVKNYEIRLVLCQMSLDIIWLMSKISRLCLIYFKDHGKLFELCGGSREAGWLMSKITRSRLNNVKYHETVWLLSQFTKNPMTKYLATILHSQPPD